VKRLVLYLYHEYQKKQQLRSDLPYINQIHTSNTYKRHIETRQLTVQRGMGTLRCFETGWHFLVELTKTMCHYYCSLLTSVPDPRNFGTDPDHRIRNRKNRSGYIQIFMDIKVIFLVVLKWKKIQICSYPVNNLISSQKFRDISRNFVTFRETKFREIKKKLFREIRNKYFAKFRDRKISSTTLAMCQWIRSLFVAKSTGSGEPGITSMDALLCPICHSRGSRSRSQVVQKSAKSGEPVFTSMDVLLYVL
jgi:hypothetical protein